MFDSTDAEVERRADLVFAGLDAFAINNIAFTTAFTTYEDLGDAVCAALERRARAWVAAHYPNNKLVRCGHDSCACSR